MNDENQMVDEEMVGSGDSAKVAPAPDVATTEGKTMTDSESTKCGSQFALFLTLVASVVLVVATGAAYDWNIRVSQIRFQHRTQTHIPVDCCGVLILSSCLPHESLHGRILVASLHMPSLSLLFPWPRRS